MKPVHQITDRAKRYRANRTPPPGPRRCNFCGSRRNVDVDHIYGDEADDDPENKMYLCRPCNTRKGITQARNRIGVRTNQYNPARRIPSFAQFRHSAAVLLGVESGDAGEATAIIRATPPAKRVEYGDKIEAENPFKSDAQRRKFFAMAERGEISQATLRKFAAGNPLFAPQQKIDRRKLKDVRYGLEVDVTGRGSWVEQGLYDTLREAERDGRQIQKREGMEYRVKVTRDRRNPTAPTFAQYAHGVSIHARGTHDEGGRIIHATPSALRSRYARQIARTKALRRGEVPF